MRDCRTCGERQDCAYYKQNPDAPRHCACYWNSRVEATKYLQKWHEELFNVADKVDFKDFLFIVQQTKIIAENIEKELTSDDE